MGTCTEKPCSAIFPNPNGKPVASVADVAFDHTFPLTALQTMRTMTSAERLLCLIRIFKHQADDILQLCEVDMLAFQTLDITLERLCIFRIEHDQIPKESNISSAVWNRGSLFTERSRTSRNAESVSAGTSF